MQRWSLWLCRHQGEERRGALPIGLQLFLLAVEAELQHMAFEVRLLQALGAIFCTVVAKVAREQKHCTLASDNKSNVDKTLSKYTIE